MPLIGDCTIDYRICPVEHIARAGVENRKPCLCVSVYDFPCVTRHEDRDRQGERIHFSTCIHPSRATATRGMGGRGKEETLYVMVIKTSGTANAFGLQFSVSHCGHSRGRLEMSQDYLVTSSHVKAPRMPRTKRHRNLSHSAPRTLLRVRKQMRSRFEILEIIRISIFPEREKFFSLPPSPFLSIYM